LCVHCFHIGRKSIEYEARRKAFKKSKRRPRNGTEEPIVNDDTGTNAQFEKQKGSMSGEK
jgi:hypothetical protein